MQSGVEVVSGAMRWLDEGGLTLFSFSAVKTRRARRRRFPQPSPRAGRVDRVAVESIETSNLQLSKTTEKGGNREDEQRHR